jgi:hypothetical protein
MQSLSSSSKPPNLIHRGRVSQAETHRGLGGMVNTIKTLP